MQTGIQGLIFLDDFKRTRPRQVEMVAVTSVCNPTQQFQNMQRITDTGSESAQQRLPDTLEGFVCARDAESAAVWNRAQTGGTRFRAVSPRPKRNQGPSVAPRLGLEAWVHLTTSTCRAGSRLGGFM